VGRRALFRRQAALPVERALHQPARMKDWLALLGLEISGGQMACYVPPCATQKWLDRSRSWRRRAIAGGRSAGGSTSCRRSNALTACAHHAEVERPLVPAKSLAAAPKKVAQADAVAARVTETKALR
jgi:hypothetical protein